MRKNLLLSLCLLVGFLTGPLNALITIPDSGSGVLFVVNDPKEMTFVDLDRLIEYTQGRLKGDKTINDRDLANFWSALREHGAPNAGGKGSTQVALIVSAKVPSTEGVLVLKGDFDKEKVREIISRHYSEHCNEHLADSRQKELGIGTSVSPISGYKTDHFVLPFRDRELHIVDMGGIVVFASHKAAELDLLMETISVLEGKIAYIKAPTPASKIVYAFNPDAEERERLVGQLDDAYNRFKDGRMNNRRGIRRFSENIRNIVVDSKYGKVREAVSLLDQALFTVDRALSGNGNGKAMSLQLTFETEDAAQTVKAGVVKHLVAEMKKPIGNNAQVALQNPKVTLEGKSVFLRVNLQTEKDQMHAFSVMAGYVAREILKTRQTPVVRKLKTVADRQAALGRQLEQQLAVETSRTSFFSFGRKFSLMFDSMKVRTDIRRCEDAFVDLTNEPKVMQSSVIKLAEAAKRDLDIMDKLIEARGKASSKNATPGSVVEMAQLRVMKSSMQENARTLLMTAFSQAFTQSAGALDRKSRDALLELEKKTGPFMYTTGQGQPVAGYSTSGQVFVSMDTETGTGTVAIPAGMTMEQAQKDYESAYISYTQTINSNDSVKIREAYEIYMSKYQVLKTMRDLEAQKNK